MAALPETDWTMMQSSFHQVTLNRDDVLLEPGGLYRRVYFPTEGIISIVAGFETGATVETAMIGAEGMVEVDAILGGRVSPRQHVVQLPGAASVLPYDGFLQWSQEIPAFQQVLFGYARAFVSQVLQTAACNAVHSVHQRAARWLLMCDDRNAHPAFSVTQQFLGEMLGASRNMVNAILRSMRQDGLIQHNRGLISISDRRGLERASCECYRLMRDAYRPASLSVTGS
ncbi:MAG: Crp/Fnr family transcriptional regulator [Acetobacteraceae bacterium]